MPIGRYQKKFNKNWLIENWYNWSCLPPLFQASLVWAFIRSGPTTPEDQLRLFAASRYGEHGPIEIIHHEVVRWMSKFLTDLWDKELSKGQIIRGINLFFSSSDIFSKHYKQCSKEKSWGKLEDILIEFDEDMIDGARRFILKDFSKIYDFGSWITNIGYRIATEFGRQNDYKFGEIFLPMEYDRYRLHLGEFRISIDGESKSIAKCLINSEDGIKFGYQSITCREGNYTFNAEGIGAFQIRDGEFNGVAQSRPYKEDSVIGGINFGMTDFSALIRKAHKDFYCLKEIGRPNLLDKYLTVYCEKYEIGDQKKLLKTWGIPPPGPLRVCGRQVRKIVIR